MDDLFRSYWWLLFPLGFFIFGAWDRWLAYQRSRDHLNLLRELSAQGKDIPPEMFKAVRDEVDDDAPPPLDPYDRYSRRHYRRYWRHRYGFSPYWQWRTFFVTGAVAAGFWFASEYADWPGVDGPFRLVAIILTCVSVGHGLAALFSSMFFTRRMIPEGLDEGLVAAAKAGSASAFARLVDRHQQPLRAFLRRACGDWALADDLAQETFLTAWSRIGSLKAGASVRAWLCGIGYHKHLTALRTRGRDRVREAAYEADRPQSVQAMTDERMTLETAMAGLPPDQRACVALCLAADFSHAEAAEALNLPLGTVKSHVTRGRQRLLVALGDPDDDR